MKRLVMLLLVLVMGWAHGESYEALRDRARQGEKIDYKALRLAFTETAAFDPYADRSHYDAMHKALNEKKFEDLLGLADKQLDINYVDIRAHFMAYLAHKGLGHDKQQAHHDAMVEGLLRSIMEPGGRSPKEAMTVISIDEEYVVLDFLGFRRTKQGVVKDNGHEFDVLTVEHRKSGETMDLYFNIDIPRRWLRQKLENPK